jgi:hypothetical protein
MHRVAQKIPEWTAFELERWRDVGDTFPDSLRKYSLAEQKEKEQEIDETVEKAAKRKSEGRSLNKEERASLMRHIRGSVTRQLSTSDDPANRKFLDECERTAEEFVRKAREFDHALSAEDIHQALRNQWVFNSLQQVLGVPITLTPSSLAYSLLYPYTDNVLDRGHRSDREVHEFLDWITARLEGQVLANRNPKTVPVGRLIAMVESEFSREHDPDAFGGLLAIHIAQQKNLTLLTPQAPTDPVAVLPLSFEKGGTSVLADAYLLTGSAEDAFARACFAYGVALQMIDDLQDVKEDMGSRHTSLFTLETMTRPLDTITSRLFRYIHNSVTPRLASFRPCASPLAAMIGQSCTYLTLEAVARHNSFYSPDYLARIGPCMPVQLAYLADAREKVTAMIPAVEQRIKAGKKKSVGSAL